MAEDDVRHLMAHDADELGLGLGGLDGAEVHEHGAAGESEGIDVFTGDDMKAEGPLLREAGSERSDGDETRAELLDVASDRVGVGKDRRLPVDFRDDLVAGLNLLLLSEGVFAGDRLELGAGGRGDAEGEQERDERFAIHDLALLRGGSQQGIHFSYWKKCVG